MTPPSQVLCGVVVSAGKMMRAVKVRTAKQVYNNFLQKHFLTYQSYLVSDPNDSLRTGDVVKFIRDTQRISPRIQHFVSEIVAPWGPSIEARPPVMSQEQRVAVRREKKERKNERKRVRREGDEVPVEGMVEGTQVAS
ncbi:hypothetical protein ACLMJK_000292 [Lecanora helva]